MEIYQPILMEAMARDLLPSLNVDSARLIEMKCYQAIQKIYVILSDETLDDPECFKRIEEIVCVLDELGIGGGGRHDF